MCKKLTVQSTIQKPLESTWNSWIDPDQIKLWYFASEDWICPTAKNNLEVGGTFVYHMAAKDGSMAFDFDGTFVEIIEHELIAFTLSDGRNVTVKFFSDEDATTIIESFDPDDQAPLEMQQIGWQAIVDNFKKHVESL